MIKQSVLLVMALPSESNGLFEKNNIEVLYTGVGKINAAYTITKKISELKSKNQKIDLVINLGTAGSNFFNKGELVECTSFVQRDMDVRAFGYEFGKTPQEEDIPLYIKTAKRFEHLRTGICGTGDSFATKPPLVDCNVLDMESYAIAKICRKEDINFAAVKYISDGADDNSTKDWNECLDDNSKKLLNFYKKEFLSNLSE